MTVKEAYKILQAEWVKLYNVEVGDTVKVLRSMKEDELGCFGTGWGRPNWNGGRVIDEIGSNFIHLEGAGHWPFFCLEVVEKREPKIEIDVKINGKTSKLLDVSEETLLNIRNKI